jgi:tetrahydrodipicolinate N-succinyltransferase
MKLTKETKQLVKEIAKKHNLNEWKFFKSMVKQAIFKKALQDKEFVKLAKQVDSSMERISQKVKDMESRGERVPDLYKNYLAAKR